MKAVMKFSLYPNSTRQDADSRLGYVDDAAFDELCRLHPASVRHHPGGITFQPELEEGTAELTAILEFLARLGLQPAPSILRRLPNQFSARIEHLYDKKDYESAEYLIPKPKAMFAASAHRTADDVLQLEEYQTKPQGPIGFAGWAWIVVSDAGRRILEEANLGRLVFRQIVVVTDEGKLPKGRFAGHWELTSDLTLPPIRQTHVQLMHDGGTPFSGDYDKGCHLVEGLYTPAELHYAQADLSSVKPFDLALTHERFGIKAGVAYRQLVASHRFYEVCSAAKLKMSWIPVRIDYKWR